MSIKKSLPICGLILVTIIWGGGFIASDIALESLKPFQIMSIRFFIASIFMYFAAVKYLKKARKEELVAGILMGLALFLGFALQTVGLKYTTASKNAFITSLNVVIVPFIAFVILRKKIALNSILGAFLSILGLALLSLDANLKISTGDALTLLCAIGFAFQIFLTGEFVKKYSFELLNFIQMLTAFILSLFCLIIFREFEFIYTKNSILSVLYLGIISTCLCYAIQSLCQKYVDETRSAIILSMESVFGTIFSVLILKEKIDLKMFIACIIILLAVIIANIPRKEEKYEL